MYHLEGSDFTDLIKREFSEKFITKEATISIENKLDFHTKTFREESFDILHFKSNIYTPVQINNLQDTTHVSLHFQLSGHSSAHIAGIKSSPGSGNFNLVNYVDPISTFVYPEKGEYEYLCVAFKPAYFDDIVAECQDFTDHQLHSTQRSHLSQLSAQARITDYWQMDTIKLIQEPPIADALKVPYIRSKVKELSFLSFAKFSDKPVQKALNHAENDRIRSVKAFLDINYLSKLTLESLSRMFILNEFKLKSGFKKEFGITVFGYIQKLRLEYAYKILMDGGSSVREVAFLIGYESDTSFVRAFKLYFNCSPGKINK